VSPANVDSLRRALEHFLRTGVPDWDAIHPEVEVYDHDIPDAGDYRGHAGYAKWLQDWADAWESYSVELGEFLDAGDKVVVLLNLRAVGAGSGIEVAREDAMVCTIEDGLTTRLDYFNSAHQGLRAAGIQR